MAYFVKNSLMSKLANECDCDDCLKRRGNKVAIANLSYKFKDETKSVSFRYEGQTELTDKEILETFIEVCKTKLYNEFGKDNIKDIELKSIIHQQ